MQKPDHLLSPATRYRQTKVNGKKKLKHRVIMENVLGRSLSGNELVHHIDDNKLNNSLDNLEIQTHKQHSILHNQKYPIIKLCLVCGTCFEPYKTKRKRAKTCSPTCRYVLTSLSNRNFGPRPRAKEHAVMPATRNTFASAHPNAGTQAERRAMTCKTYPEMNASVNGGGKLDDLP